MICVCCVENPNVIENVLHLMLYFEITEHFGGEHYYEENEKQKNPQLIAEREIHYSSKNLVKLQFKMSPLRHKRTSEGEGTFFALNTTPVYKKTRYEN